MAVFFMFATPYWMGERRPRILFLASLVMLLITAVAVTSFFTLDLYQPQAAAQRSPDGVLSGGTVDPYSGDMGTEFTFKVLYTNAEPPLEPPRVDIASVFSPETTINASLSPADPQNLDYVSGVLFAVTLKLPEAAHSFRFVVQLPDGTWVQSADAVTLTERSRGPINAPPLALFSSIFLSLAVFTYTLIGIPLLLVVAIYAFRRRRRRPGKEPPPGD